MKMITDVSPADAAIWVEQGDAVLFDVREASELAVSSIPGAVHLPMSQLIPSRLGLAQGKRALFVCAHGMRSLHVAQRLIDAGVIEDAYNVTGGTTAWAEAGLPLTVNQAA